MTNEIVIAAVTGIITLLLSIGTSAVMIGVKWGKMETNMQNMQTDLAEIKGMFRLTLKE